MQGNKKAQHTPSPADGEATAVAAVLGNDDLLPLILLRLGFPTSLVRAALVCRRWYRAASLPGFLRHFRRLHPPCVLGFYGDFNMSLRPRFVPLAEAPELATATRRASTLDGRFTMWNNRNGGLLVKYCDKPKDGRGDGALIVEVLLDHTRFVAKLSTLQSGSWMLRTTETVELLFPDPEASHSVKDVLPPVRGKTYMKVDSRSILEMDLVAASVSVIQLPDAVNTENYELSCGEDSEGLFLVYGHGSLLSVWHKAIGNGSSGGWVLVNDAIRVREACKNHQDFTVYFVDSNLGYVFLAMNRTDVLVILHLKSRTEKVYAEFRMPHCGIRYRLAPFMMLWPPMFPALREDNLQ